MKTKNCDLCKVEESILFRIQIDKGKRGFLYANRVARNLKNWKTTNMAELGKVHVIDSN